MVKTTTISGVKYLRLAMVSRRCTVIPRSSSSLEGGCLLEADGFEVPEERHHDGEGHRRLAGGDGDDEKREHLALEVSPDEAGERDEVDVSRS